jgi:transposase
MDRDLLASMLAEGLSLAAIGRRVGRHESTVAYWLDYHGLRPVNGDRHAARGGLTREQLEPLVEAGMSIAQIAARVDRSKATVRHWLRQHGLNTANVSRARRAAASAAARDGGLSRAKMVCAVHGETVFVARGDGRYRCGRCRSADVAKRRRRIKQTLVEEAGGACALCGYDRCLAALEFHHLDPAEKQFELSQRGVTRSIAIARAEAAKCVLLCSNCHAEVEAGQAAVIDPRVAGLQCGEPRQPGVA